MQLVLILIVYNHIIYLYLHAIFGKNSCYCQNATREEFMILRKNIYPWLRDVAIIAMERDITINILENKLDEIVDAFGEARDRSDLFLTDNFQSYCILIFSLIRDIFTVFMSFLLKTNTNVFLIDSFKNLSILFTSG